jgi:hypothetical protein
MRRNSKVDIRLEVPEPFWIYLMPDVTSQRSGITRLCVCERQMGTNNRGPAYILQPRDYGVAKQRTGFRPKLPVRRERPAAWKGEPVPPREDRRLAFAEKLQRTKAWQAEDGKRRDRRPVAVGDATGYYDAANGKPSGNAKPQ